ncbi:uncharacterized protein LOC127875052 [Dreissena polymorpha]|uniref:Mab-21-like HhH/H2TH-like domain-containing protein n=1 Tax=Dreissena polymorpha TaxID=45954 RepID=A0A9D4R456_DREPO|nr:uncharacterized protein LOC127875052 [Dreissena polymorpha]XP_052275828.1 uncharacterized protein LOC127875052 [Dreissena polymorpha]XP_052275829.1 uncharacterized protein LOC127875052 [Dreissena polymorpha]XP_052275830.1 uncharacterized protein LOC127875052 [Dreissena polymorpha]XP_052275831.1 uncharacterized protein LOC127875052 [Dreissena polymorpha]XP_052275832.1 uncharacterized protein LOC127875052 [Dreissena polymorpha]XP_052275833.1 uncharacterized protein LOC127875052 [Dreissena po
MTDPTYSNTLLARLFDRAKQRTNDRRWAAYVRYINAGLEVLGKERVYLVGSTGENLNLRLPSDRGDADFLLVSGRLEVPVANIEYRLNTPLYLWIRGKGLDMRYCGRLVDDTYLSADMLRTVHPMLFTMIRALCTIVTAPLQFVPGRYLIHTCLGMPSRVGIAFTEFRQLKIEDTDSLRMGPNAEEIMQEEVESKLKRRQNSVKMKDNDAKLFKRVQEMASFSKTPSTRGEHHGRNVFLATMIDEALRRKSGVNQSEGDCNSEMETIFQDVSDEHDNEFIGKVKATYDDIAGKDFVPALRIDGKLSCIEEFCRRVQSAKWPPRNVVNDIDNKCEFFIIARDAPLNPSKEKDFCLSFNLAEIMLNQNLPPTAKRVYILMKAYLKGIFKKTFDSIGRFNPIKSYYMKTSIFWTCEIYANELCWNETSEHSILDAVQIVLRFLLGCIKAKKLRHYFTESNLFDGVADLDLEIAGACIYEIQAGPFEKVQDFFDVESEHKREVLLDHEAARRILSLQQDGGRRECLNRLDDSFIDMARAFNDASCDPSGDSIVKEIVLRVADTFLEEQKQRASAKKADKSGHRISALDKTSNKCVGQRDLSKPKLKQAPLIKLLNNFVTNDGAVSHGSGEASQRLGDLLAVGSLFPVGRDFINNIGGEKGAKNVLEQVDAQESDSEDRLRKTVERYLTCKDEEEPTVAIELKQMIAIYFLANDDEFM